jgi:hypothetical protein
VESSTAQCNALVIVACTGIRVASWQCSADIVAVAAVLVALEIGDLRSDLVARTRPALSAGVV